MNQFSAPDARHVMIRLRYRKFTTKLFSPTVPASERRLFNADLRPHSLLGLNLPAEVTVEQRNVVSPTPDPAAAMTIKFLEAD